jgi:hypothetical protein
MLNRTEEISCNLPAKDRCLEHQESIQDVNLATKPSQSAAVSLDVIKGTPKYLTGNLPFVICNKTSNSCLTSSERPKQKTELLRGLAFNPKISSNSFKTSKIILMESKVAVEKMRRSSAN